MTPGTIIQCDGITVLEKLFDIDQAVRVSNKYVDLLSGMQCMALYIYIKWK